MPEVFAVAIVLLFTGSLVALAVRRLPRLHRSARLVGLAAGATGSALIVAAADHRVPPPRPQPHDVPLQALADEDTASTACGACHPHQYSTWHASYHRTMTQTASPQSVIGDFADVQLEFQGERYRLFEREGQFFGEITGAGSSQSGASRRVVVPLKQTTGSHHMQIYWYPSAADRMLEAFPLVYLRGPQRWIPRLAAFVTPPSEGATASSVWNYTCIGCHTTHPRPRLSGARLTRADSHVTELGIACEACHGSGQEHVAANGSPLRRYQLHLSSESDETIVNPAQLPHVRSSQVCGQCHSVRTFYSEQQARAWAQHGSSYRPGDDLEAVVSLVSNATLSRPYTQEIMRQFPDFVSGSFWEDGIVRVTGREYNALKESPCFQRGELACISCHTMHKAWDDPRELAEWADDQLAPGMNGDRACTQCHSQFAGEQEAQLAADHAHHRPGSTGSACQNCHMPYTTYGLLKAVRGHEISNPIAVTVGPSSARPNACNLCHLDRTLAWTAERLASWYGQPVPPLSEDDRRISAGARWALAGDAGVRALLAWSMGWRPAQEAAGRGWLVPYLLELMQDPYDAVRIIAYRSLQSLPGYEGAQFDELASPDRRTEASDRIRDHWSALPSSSQGKTERTLFDAEGRLVSTEFARLLSLRDHRPLNLAE